ncbi:SAG-related sequence [Besnoitia besnoiti]|uniref:SAG-related sequence n=1 Tax=Besnoitia besnoiti TaxID=94643 RepID=A0A2A9MN46_BESBE|nr:SAG-related sequence [Besnoitia besnoiti]PFH37032.1 SAG-related sequence [Besnoitia besnoiti]
MAGSWRIQRGTFKSKACHVMAFCVGGVLLMASGNALPDPSRDEFLRQNVAGEEGPQLNLLCRVTSSGRAGGDAPLKVTLSDDQLTTTLLCGDGSQAVPTDLETVCNPKEVQTVQDCQSNGTVQLKTLLGSPRDIKWSKQGQSGNVSQSQTWELTLREEDLPFTDKEFFVGCQKGAKGAGQTTCKVDVTVKARDSEKDDNVVTCAYGSESNFETVDVEVTREHNTLTVACGKDGTITPKAYDAYYCEDATLKPCAKSYKDILPAFQETWWKQEGGENAPLKLTIPKEGFPAEDKTFYVGCSPKSSTDPVKVSRGGEGETDATPAIKGPTTCKVMVTVKAGSASLAASATKVISVVFGIAPLTWLITGTF